VEATELLIQDHNRVKKLFIQLEAQSVTNANLAMAVQLFGQLAKELSLHAIVEEQNFYPALAAQPQFSALLKDSYHEHADMKMMIGELAQLDATSKEWKQMLTQLKQAVEHHVQDEEQKLFPQVREKLSISQLQMLGLQLEQAKVINLPGVYSSLPMQIEQLVLTEAAVQASDGLKTARMMGNAETGNQSVSLKAQAEDMIGNPAPHASGH